MTSTSSTNVVETQDSTTTLNFQSRLESELKQFARQFHYLVYTEKEEDYSEFVLLVEQYFSNQMSEDVLQFLKNTSPKDFIMLLNRSCNPIWFFEYNSCVVFRRRLDFNYLRNMIVEKDKEVLEFLERAEKKMNVSKGGDKSLTMMYGLEAFKRQQLFALSRRLSVSFPFDTVKCDDQRFEKLKKYIEDDMRCYATNSVTIDLVKIYTLLEFRVQTLKIEYESLMPEPRKLELKRQVESYREQVSTMKNEMRISCCEWLENGAAGSDNVELQNARREFRSASQSVHDLQKRLLDEQGDKEREHDLFVLECSEKEHNDEDEFNTSKINLCLRFRRDLGKYHENLLREMETKHQEEEKQMDEEIDELTKELEMLEKNQKQKSMAE